MVVIFSIFQASRIKIIFNLKLYGLLLFIFLIACSIKKDSYKDKIDKDTCNSDTVPSRQKANNYSKNGKEIVWYGGEMFGMKVSEDSSYLDYFFTPQCIYTFPVTNQDSLLTIFWSKDIDCLTDLELDKSFGITDTPEVGKPFATFSLTNDSLLLAFYLYPAWVKQVNIQKGEIFPNKFHIKYLIEK